MLEKIRKMANDAFVDFCYTTILQRKADEQGKNHYVTSLDKNILNREEILLLFLTSEEYRVSKDSQEFVVPGHFYSVIPSKNERLRFVTEKKNTGILGVALNDQAQKNLLEDLRQFTNRCPFPENKTGKFRYYFNNPAYSYGDALFLYSMIQHFKPVRIIEIGSGFSSCVMLDTNDLDFNGNINISFIEPFPQLLLSLIKKEDGEKYQIFPSPLQNIEMNVFKNLAENDILFIDSTHVSKLSSDVNKIFFEILPSLQKGVIIHIHDIFWPFEYPDPWIMEGRAWNETYMLRAFLEYNSAFEILLFPGYLNAKYSDWFKKHMPLFLINPGGSIWLRKTAQL